MLLPQTAREVVAPEDVYGVSRPEWRHPIKSSVRYNGGQASGEARGPGLSALSATWLLYRGAKRHPERAGDDATATKVMLTLSKRAAFMASFLREESTPWDL